MKWHQTIVVADGHEVGVCGSGSPDDVAVFWCHGGPGSQLEPAFLAEDAAAARLRLVRSTALVTGSRRLGRGGRSWMSCPT